MRCPTVLHAAVSALARWGTRALARAGAWLACAGLALGLASCGARVEPRPDVILIVVDTLRADRLSCYGYPRPTSPVIDQLAREGVRFEDCTAQSAWTRPSVVSLLQGRYFTGYRDEFDPALPTLAECFQKAGYRTLGLSANLLLKARYGFGRGFDEYDDRRANQDPAEPLSRPRNFERLCADLWPLLDQPNGTGERVPLFLYLQPFDPHAPYLEHPEFDAELPWSGAGASDKLDWQSRELAAHGYAPASNDPSGERALRFLLYQRGIYDQELRYTDQWIGKLLEGLRARGRLEHAIVAIVADHGEGLWDHVAWIEHEKLSKSPPAAFFYQQHGAHLYQEAIHTPFVLWGRGVPAGRVCAAPVENVDLAPTLLDLANVPALGELHGRSLRALFAGSAPPADWRGHVYSTVMLGESVRECASGLKLIDPSAMGQRFRTQPELYDLRADRAERAPLDGDRSAELARLRAALAGWRSRYPSVDTLGRPRDSEEQRDLEALGYGADHTGEPRAPASAQAAESRAASSQPAHAPPPR